MSGMTTVAPRETLSQLLERMAPHGVTKSAAREALLEANPHLASAGSSEHALPEGYLVLVPFATKGTSVRSASDDAFARAAGLVRALSTLENALAKRKPSAATTLLGMTSAATTSEKPSDAVARTLQKILAALPEATRGLR